MQEQEEAAKTSPSGDWDLPTQLNLLNPLLMAPPADLTEQVHRLSGIF